MAKLTNAQLNAVVDTIKVKKIKNKEKLIKFYKEKLKNNEKYKQIIYITDVQVELRKKIRTLEEEENKNAKKLYDLSESTTIFYSHYYKDFYLNQLIEEFLSKEMKKDGCSLTVDEEALKNELLVASIDSNFNIQQFIEKYSK